MDNKIEFIKNFGEINQFSEQKALFSAFIACLEPVEACSLLDLDFEQEYLIRCAILKKIGQDIETNLQTCHKELVKNLLQSFENHSYRKKQSAASCLSFLHDFLPESIQDEIVIFLIQSKYVCIRRTGYKKLRKWKTSFSLLIEQNWNIYQDLECAELIIEHFPVEYLETNLEKLQEIVFGTRFLARLYLKVTKSNPSYLESLQAVDEITFAYVSAKVNKPFTNEQALDIFERQKYNEKLGLLIWCFGQMKLWSALEKINGQLEQVVYERVVSRKAKYA